MEKVRRFIFNTLECHSGSLSSRICDLLLVLLIMANVMASILETVDSLAQTYGSIFRALETVSIVVFSVEYVLRIWSCTASKDYTGVGGRVRFALSPLLLIDLIVLALDVVLERDARMFRAIRMLRIFRIGRYSARLRRLGRIFVNKKEELVISVALALLLLVICSTLMYEIEKDEQPEAFGSIPATMWWGVATLTTVGYGDAYPVTPLGKVLGAIIAIIGIGLFALPAGIVASGFGEALEDDEEKAKSGLDPPPPSSSPEAQVECCPHCGKSLADPPERAPDAQS